ncbi:MAG: hypothetical protein GEV03_17505 [Streptosporangiales bacterium]|nr:hypothetical protein [Streptosporangiales bacterium]
MVGQGRWGPGMLERMSISARHELMIIYGGVDEPAEEIGRRMRHLLSDLGRSAGSDCEWWADVVNAAAEAGTPALLARLNHADPEVRRAVTRVLEWCWDDAEQILPALWTWLSFEPDAPARVGIVLAAARLAAALPRGEDRTASERRLYGYLDRGADSAACFAAALGLVEHLLPGSPVPAAVLDALAATLDAGGDAYTALWGQGWDMPLDAAIHALRDRPEDQVALLLRAADNLRARKTWVVKAGAVLERSPDRGRPLVPVLGRLVLDAEPAVRELAARKLSYLGGPVILPAMDMLAAALDDPVANVREQSAHALARAGDSRCVAPLREMLSSYPLPRDVEHLVAGMRAHAAELLPTVRRRLAAVPPVAVVFLDDRRTRVEGGLRAGEHDLIAGLGTWGNAAAPVVPELRRLLDLYRAEQARCADRLTPDYYPLVHGVRVVQSTLDSILGDQER